MGDASFAQCGPSMTVSNHASGARDRRRSASAIMQTESFLPRTWRGPRTFLAGMCFLLACSLAALQMPDPGTGALPDLPNIRGTVKSIHGSDATIQTEEGQTYTVHTSDNTRIYKQRQPLKMSQVLVGDMLMAAGSLDEKAHLMRAVFVADVDAATVEKMRAELGKTWIAGKVLKIEDANITIDRMDHKTQVIQADDTTSFRKDGQSITLLDVHVGDPVRGKGSLQKGVFVPTQLTVIDTANRRRPRADSNPASSHP